MPSSRDAVATTTEIDDRAEWLSVRIEATGADQELGDFFDRFLSGGQSDPLQLAKRERVEPLERQCQVSAPLVGRDRVNLVHDHGLRFGERSAAPLRRQQDVERLRRGYQAVRWPADL